MCSTKRPLTYIGWLKVLQLANNYKKKFSKKEKEGHIPLIRTWCKHLNPEGTLTLTCYISIVLILHEIEVKVIHICIRQCYLLTDSLLRQSRKKDKMKLMSKRLIKKLLYCIEKFNFHNLNKGQICTRYSLNKLSPMKLCVYSVSLLPLKSDEIARLKVLWQ